MAEQIKENFKKVGGLIDKVSEKLTDTEFKEIYDELKNLREMSVSGAEQKYIKIKYNYRYVTYWYDHEEGEMYNDISRGHDAVKIFKIKPEEQDNHPLANVPDSLKNVNIYTLTNEDDRNPLELDKKFVDIYICDRPPTNMLNFDFSGEDVYPSYDAAADNIAEEYRFGHIQINGAVWV